MCFQSISDHWEDIHFADENNFANLERKTRTWTETRNAVLEFAKRWQGKDYFSAFVVYKEGEAGREAFGHVRLDHTSGSVRLEMNLKPTLQNGAKVGIEPVYKEICAAMVLGHALFLTDQLGKTFTEITAEAPINSPLRKVLLSMGFDIKEFLPGTTLFSATPEAMQQLRDKINLERACTSS